MYSVWFLCNVTHHVIREEEKMLSSCYMKNSAETVRTQRWKLQRFLGSENASNEVEGAEDVKALAYFAIDFRGYW